MQQKYLHLFKEIKNIYILYMDNYTKFKYLIITKNDMNCELHRSLRDLGNSINMNYSTLSRYLKNKQNIQFTHNDVDYIIKIIDWD